MKCRKAFTARVLVGLILTTMIHGVQAADTEIVLDDTTLGGSVENGDSVSADGLTMTITNVVATDGSSSADVEGVGILCGTDAMYTDMVSMEFSFNVDVRVTGYIIGGREDIPEGAYLTISGTNGTSNANLIPEFAGFTPTEIELPFSSGDLVVLKADQTYTISHNLSELAGGDPLFNLEALFVTPVYTSIDEEGALITIEYVGILQRFDPDDGWQDVDPQPSNRWQFTPSSDAELYRARQ